MSMNKRDSLAKKIRDIGGVCFLYPTSRHNVLIETSKDGVEVSLDVYGNEKADEPTDTRAEKFETLESALEGFMIDGKPLCDFGCDPVEPFVPTSL